MISIKNTKLNKNKFFAKAAVMLALSIFLQCFVVTGTTRALTTSKLTGIILSDLQITFKWTDYLTDEKQYILERKTDAGAFETRLVFNYANVTSCTDSYDKGHTYTYRVKVIDSANNMYVYTDEIIFRPGDVQKPNSLTVTPVSHDQIDLRWGYPDQKAYNTIIERKAEGETNWNELARVGIGQNTFSDKAISSGVRYYYRVRAFANESITTIAYTEEGIAAYSLLYKPTELYGFALSKYQIQLTWKDNSAETAFIIERRSPDEGVFKQVAVVPQNNNAYIDSDTKLKPDTTYTYRVKAVTGTTSSEYSDVINVTTTYLKPPGNLTSSSADGKSIILKWLDFTDNETGFEVWRKKGASPSWELYETMGRNATTFTDLTVSLDDNYSYKVRAKINNNNVYSDFSNITTVWSSTITAPENLTYEVVGKSEIKLSWKDTSNIEAGFTLERKIGLAGEWYAIAHMNPNTVTYNDKWINNTDTYYYRVKVFDRANSINYSNELMVSLRIPDAPSDLKAHTISSSEVLLAWKDNSINESEFIIEVKQYHFFREIGRVNSNITSFVSKDLLPARTLTFRVRAVNGSNQSNPSNEVIATTGVKVTYTDLKNVGWAVEAINNLASRGVFDAKSGAKFYPEQAITKGEFTAIVMRSMQLQNVAVGSYADVTPKHKYYKEIMAAAKYGILSPDKNNSINPDSAVTREQAAVILSNALKVNGTPLPQRDSSTLKQFADYKSISSGTAEKIAAVFSAGIMSGKADKGKIYLSLNNRTTRAEAAVMTFKAINFGY